MQTTWLKALKLGTGFLLFSVAWLCSAATHAAQTGSWSGSGGNYTSTDGVTTVSATYSGGSFSSFSNDTVNNLDDIYTPDVGGDASHQWVFNPGVLSTNEGRIVFEFPYPVTDPVLHIDRLGGRSSGVINTAAFTLNTGESDGAQSLTRRSGVDHFVVDESDTRIRGGFNVNSDFGFSTECRASSLDGTACGSVQVNGTFTEVVFDLQMLGAPGSGDGIELIWTYNEVSDMRPEFSNLPNAFFPGDTYTDLELTCINDGPYAATGAFCQPSVDEGTISNLSCSPASPASVSANNSSVCTFDWQAPVSVDTVNFTGQTGASNDNDGGNDGTAGNNQVTQTVQDIASSAAQCPTTDLSDSGAGAGYATSGDGQYKDSLLWLDWNCGTKNTFQTGDVIRKTWEYGPLEVTALLYDIEGSPIEPYNTGDFGGDRLDSFYGGVNPVGLSNVDNGVGFSYEIQWETRLNGLLVDNIIAVADAESTDGSEGWRVTTDQDPWELIDVASGTGLQLEWSADGRTLDANPSGNLRGSFVALSDNIGKTSFVADIVGKQAAAYAVPFGRDFGDLPAAYDNALPGHHLLRRIGDGGSKPTSPTTATSIDLADFILDPISPYLGAIEPISRNEATPNASADAHEQDDGVQLPDSLVPGSSVTIPVFVSGSGTLDAWVDWDGNDNFNGGDEQIAANVSGTDVINLTVTVPDDAQPGETFARFRWSSQSSLSPSAIAADGEVEDYRITILEPTTRISGRVFNDNGLNSATGGIAHDGEVNGDEAGLGGVMVKALDNSNGNCQPGDVLAETTTNGNGDWSLALGVNDENTPACLVAETPNGFRAISESDGTAGTDITLDALDDAEMTFTVPSPGTVWEGINFGKVGSPRLVPNQQGDVAPGNVIFYRHQFTAATAGEVTFSLANPTSTPDSPAWSQQVIRDPSCSGEADFNEPLTVNVEAEEQLCLLVRVFAPADAPTGAQHSVELTATQTLALADNSTVTDSAAVTDITRVQTGQLGLEKRVRNIGVDGAIGGGDDGDTAFTTRNQGEPCEVLRYEIRYTNGGSSPIDDLEVNDATPAYTSLAAGVACPTSFPENLTGCTANTPDGTNAEGYQGSVAWQFDGQLAPGAQGTVSYDVRIEGAAGQCPP
ncbi:GEVED domain-containing protein [Halomonas almeriensis]|uniref:CshA/CshB family fibrillar adhesin-related protein n=1 Tax=Halomonas almeriensis TaxID=308163 RepID=UPI0025B541DA|nr:CshA/CshB family fibrillar adhesin-related protein [Halomonas almeriensis]MDN3553518.1 GEVED domain-containing protein [Halomonas almeriensis]